MRKARDGAGGNYCDCGGGKTKPYCDWSCFINLRAHKIRQTHELECAHIKIASNDIVRKNSAKALKSQKISFDFVSMLIIDHYRIPMD